MGKNVQFCDSRIKQNRTEISSVVVIIIIHDGKLSLTITTFHVATQTATSLSM